MKILKIIGIIVLVVVVLALGLVLFGPSSGHLERQTVINAPASAVYAEVSNLKTFNQWSPWFKLDPDAEYQWEGPITGVGAKQIWYSSDENVGNGYMEITEVRDNEFVAMDMGFDQNNNRDFSDEGEEEPTASFILEEVEGGTKVTWTFDITGVSGFEKMMIVGLEMFLGQPYEEGLAALKERVESAPKFNADISVQEVGAITYAGMEVTTSLDPDEIAQAMGDTYGQIIAAITQSGATMDEGYPLAVTTDYNESGISMICGIPVTEDATIDSEVVSIRQSPEGATLRALHLGSYDNLEATHEEINQYAGYYGYEITGMPWEIYVTDPSMEVDTTKWITEVYYPVK